jgi:cytochrome P450
VKCLNCDETISEGEASTLQENKAIVEGDRVKYGTHALCPHKRLKPGEAHRDGGMLTTDDERWRRTRTAVHRLMTERPHGKA